MLHIYSLRQFAPSVTILLGTLGLQCLIAVISVEFDTLTQISLDFSYVR